MPSWKEVVMSYITDDKAKGDPVENHYAKDFPLNAGGLFHLKTIRGSVKITTADAPQIKVEAVICSEGGDQERLDKVRIIENVSGAKVYLEVDYSEIRKIKALDGIFVHFKIEMPEDASLTLDAHKADYDVDAPQGPLAIISGKANGQVKNIRNAFQYENNKGRFIGTLEGPHPVSISDHGGNVQLNVKGEQDYSVKGQTRKGLISVNGADVRQELTDKRSVTVEGVLGAGTHPMKLETDKGNINVTFMG